MGCGCEAARSTRSKVAFHVYAEDGFESSHRTEKAAVAAAKRRSRTRGIEYRVVKTDAYGMTGGGRGTRIATFRRGEAVDSVRFVPDVAHKAKAADQRYGYFRPDDVFTVEAIHLSEKQRKKLAERILEKADDPYVSVSLGTFKVTASKDSYFGDELFVAIREALHRPHRFEPKGNRFVLL